MRAVFHERYLQHVQSPGHPESPERLTSIVAALEAAGLADDIVVPEPAPQEAAETVHTHEYVEMFKAFGEGYMDPDTYCREDTYEIALLAIGGFLKAVELGRSGQPAIGLVRPPGHHAGADYNCGFCYLNNIAIGAQALASEGKK